MMREHGLVELEGRRGTEASSFQTVPATPPARHDRLEWEDLPQVSGPELDRATGRLS